MTLRIQDPKYANSPSLHESLLEACKGASTGGGAFSFATKGGVELFLGDEVFASFAQTKKFDLIVGIDAITNVVALNTLANFEKELEGLSVRVFFHQVSGALFHPKFCWFRHRTHGLLIVGSGNLTPRGLRGNWEAFTFTSLDLREFAAVEQMWEAWVAFNEGLLKSAADQDVLARASLNISKVRKVVTTPRTKAHVVEVETAETEEDEDIIAGPDATDRVLVAEIPKSKSRWKQANFTLDLYKNFFGMSVKAGSETRVLLQHVLQDGTLGELENRPGVPVKSQNYRIELSAGTGLPYPKQGRPTAVFVRIAPRTFTYQLLLPGDGGLHKCIGILRRRVGW
ncbi:MAG TPA: phospholipase D family protein [Pyrinomonadaceae bacterium]|nr:phospholipase D family protein [Pyrinomonadaceae bacterium]